MCRALKTYVVASALFIIASLVYKVSPLVIYQTTNKDNLINMGYRYLGDRNKFEQWKVNYSLFKNSLIKNVPGFSDIKDEKEGAYLLMRWCNKNVNTSSGSQKDFKLIKRHCVVNIKNTILEEGKYRTIDNIPKEERQSFLIGKINSCRVYTENILGLCAANFRLADIPKNYSTLEITKSCCAIPTS